MTEFTERYQKLSKAALLEIIANASSYKVTAVETAKLELLTRGVSEEDLNEIIAVNLEEAAQQQKLLNEQQKNKQTKKNVFFNSVNPFLKGLESHERQIRLLSWMFSIISICVVFIICYFIIENYSFFMVLLRYPFEETFGYYFADVKASYLVSVILFILSIIVGAAVFWKRNRIGWILMTIGIIGSSIAFVMPLVHLLFFTPQHQANEIIDEFMMSDITIVKNICYTIFFMFSLYVLFKGKVRNVFNVNSISVYLTVLLAILLQFFIWYPFLRI